MLPCIQTSSPENFTAAGNNNDMGVLERRQEILQRLSCQQQEDQRNLNSPQTTMPLFEYQNLMNSLKIHQENFPNLGFPCSQVTSNANLSELDHQRPSFSNVSANSCKDQHVACTKKRRAENDAEEEEEEEYNKDKMPGREAGEVQSGITIKNEKETSVKISNSKASEVVQKADYIHVRARRGQATDSHSLAERARREKISKKMKCLQDLVPGCNKVTGKAGMLDEIINYVQSLQKQVEFLSMKLAALNPQLDIHIDNFFGREFPPAATPIEVVHSALFQYSRGQQEPTCSGVNTEINSTQVLPHRIGTSSMLFPEAYLESVSSLCQVQQMSTWDSDWQYNVSFH